ncbi:hypothetical protein DMJ13_26215 [halophilic archaeon]|nr:hypothetical protein DMJ13_26215 [halophilic archaeon]
MFRATILAEPVDILRYVVWLMPGERPPTATHWLFTVGCKMTDVNGGIAINGEQDGLYLIR